MAKSGKTRKAVSKRFKKTGTGKLKFSRPGRRHLASSKSSGRRRDLRRKLIAKPGDHDRLMHTITTH